MQCLIFEAICILRSVFLLKILKISLTPGVIQYTTILSRYFEINLIQLLD